VDQVQKRVLSNLQDLSTLSCGHDGWNVGVHLAAPPKNCVLASLKRSK
jgi:hypothetical protein